MPPYFKDKNKIFLNDIYEKDKRLNLNFGHTFAHAIEMSIENNLRKDYIRHGEAVGLGLLSELFYANKRKNNLLNLYSNYWKLLIFQQV